MKRGYDVLVACEFSGIVRDAFRDEGYNAVSIDLQETESDSENHIQGNVLELLKHRGNEFELMIAHPPCTYLCNSGVRWLYEREERWQDMINASVFFRKLLRCDKIPHIAVENPVMHKWAKRTIGIDEYPDEYRQTIQPWQFGEPEKKAICLWLKNLPKLEPTEVIRDEDKREAKVHKMPPGEERSKKRSRFFEGVAQAMAKQWGQVIDNL
ncbi:hypothetical protein 7908G4G3_22 [Haloquadratum phage sp.]|nr:hypothetical protein 7908G4G3_22 [Haloquadratum phage sp.]